MVRKLLLLAGVALSLPAFSQNAKEVEMPSNFGFAEPSAYRVTGQYREKVKLNDGGVSTVNKAKAPGAKVQWKRPAGQFWGTGYLADNSGILIYTPLVLRPWTEYTFENISTVSGTPAWEVTSFDDTLESFVTSTSTERNIKQSWSLFDMCPVPMLSYDNQIPYASQYIRKQFSELGQYFLCVNQNIKDEITNLLDIDVDMPVSSHVYGICTRNSVDFPYGLYTGAAKYEGMEEGFWFGTNNSGVNAMATRFEKPDRPYLMNAVYFYYQMMGDVPKEIPLKAYVFKTINDAQKYELKDGTIKERAELGDLIATAEAVIPTAIFNEDTNFDNVVKFEFFETNPVTGSKTAISLEIEDDITVVVTGFDADLGNGSAISSVFSRDSYDEGYGNLGFIGSLEEGEDGSISYELTALWNAFQAPLDNTVLGVMAGVEYPWLMPYAIEQDSDILLPNEDSTTPNVQGLQYVLPLLSTSSIDDWDVTFNGEDSCDWFDIVGVDEETHETESGEEEYSGVTWLLLQADPNPEDVSRTCVVRFTIPAASY
ncbi:MAG: hypothetical protein K2J58_05725, partial [Muribaculaceae bacterium]|nr:hypothetical protein [Muribaculaceae bacterium]